MTEEQKQHESSASSEPRGDLGELIGGIGRTIQEGIRSALQGRGNVLMVRVNDESLRAIDALVEAGLFKTRSEAAAFLIHEGIQSKQDVFRHISETVQRITEMREQLRGKLHREEKAAEPTPREEEPGVTPEP